MANRIWLKNIGASDERLPAKWYDEGSSEGEFRWFVRLSEAFSGADRISQGDLLLYHAFVDGQPTGRVVGVARVSSDQPDYDPRSGGDQWPWLRRVTPLLIVPLAGHGPTLADIGVTVPPMGGYKETTPSILRKTVELLASNAMPKTTGP
jgi:hypothetical protein